MRITDMTPNVLADMPACPRALAVKALRDTAIDFCKRTKVWSEIQDPFDLEDGQADYDIDAPTDARVIDIVLVKAGAVTVHPRTISQLEAEMPDWPSALGSTPRFFNSAIDFGSIRVFPTPVQPAVQLVVRAVYVPKRLANTLPDSLVEAYGEALEEGAQARLFASVGKPWLNAQASTFHQTRYDQLCGAAEADQLHDRVSGSITVKARRFGS